MVGVLLVIVVVGAFAVARVLWILVGVGGRYPRDALLLDMLVWFIVG